MLFSLILSIDKNVIKVYNNKNVKLFHQHLVDIALKYGWYIGQAKKHFLVLKLAVISPEDCLLFIVFLDPYPMISNG